MPNKPLKPCKKIGCINLTNEAYCADHLYKEVERKKDSDMMYDKYKRDQKSISFYHSKEWNAVRKQALRRDKFLCQYCLKGKHIKKADMVHHITEVKKNWSKRLELTNLISLCSSCHNKINHYKG